MFQHFFHPLFLISMPLDSFLNWISSNTWTLHLEKYCFCYDSENSWNQYHPTSTFCPGFRRASQIMFPWRGAARAAILCCELRRNKPKSVSRNCSTLSLIISHQEILEKASLSSCLHVYTKKHCFLCVCQQTNFLSFSQISWNSSLNFSFCVKSGLTENSNSFKDV